MQKWMIVYTARCAALEKLAAVLANYLPYVVPCETAPREGFHTVTLAVDPAMEGFSIDVTEPGDSQSVTLKAADEVNLYYAVSDFAAVYLPYARAAGRHSNPYYFFDIFGKDPLKPYHVHTKPHIARRGLWLWGYTVYDYRRFIENMAGLKLNTLILWNDELPVNIADVIAYGKQFGVKTYLGFAWGWDTSRPKVIDDAYLMTLSQSILAEYEDKYASLGCDGIYFQSFTEQGEDTIGGRLVAEAVVTLVNRTAEALLAKHPAPELLFGLHATSVNTHLDEIAKTDSRVSIIWEDCGAFPYAYLPEQTKGFEDTVAFQKKLFALNGGAFGAVLKGVTCLNWDTFRHLGGPYVIGRADKAYIRRRTEEKREMLRYLQALWIKNARFARDMILPVPHDSLITCLVEDGMFEEVLDYPTALYAAMLWDPDRPVEDILAETAARPDVDFA